MDKNMEMLIEDSQHEGRQFLGINWNSSVYMTLGIAGALMIMLQTILGIYTGFSNSIILSFFILSAFISFCMYGCYFNLKEERDEWKSKFQRSTKEIEVE